MWIAFKLLSLWRQKQHTDKLEKSSTCCELLSNYYLCDVRNNRLRGSYPTVCVVNCFQIIIFVTSETTPRLQFKYRHLLWIAFKLLSLWRQKQLICNSEKLAACCELLSNYYLCDVRNNFGYFARCAFCVVNCFQIIIFVTSETTSEYSPITLPLLWIAFKLLSLWRQKQPSLLVGAVSVCCELLSNYYLCDVRNNM